MARGQMNWLPRPSVVPDDMAGAATPAFGALPVADERLAAPWLPDELPDPPPMVEEESSDSVDSSAQSHNGSGTAESAAFMSAAEQYARSVEMENERRLAELETAVATTYAEAFAAGEEAGRDSERERLASALATAEQALDAVRGADSTLRGRLEENICALAVGIARMIVMRELATDSEMVSGFVRQALIEFPIDQPVVIRINPSDLAAITALSLAGDGSPGITAGREARWVADPSFSRATAWWKAGSALWMDEWTPPSSACICSLRRCFNERGIRLGRPRGAGCGDARDASARSGRDGRTDGAP